MYYSERTDRLFYYLESEADKSDDKDKNTPRMLRSRKNRKERRSTGVIHYDEVSLVEKDLWHCNLQSMHMVF